MLEDELLTRGIEEVAVLGFSAGAYRALALALDSTRVRVTSLAMVGGVAGFDDDVRERYRQLAGMVREGFDFVPVWLGLMAAPGFAQRFPQHVHELLAWVHAAPSEVLAQELDAFANCPDLRPRLGELRVPTLARVGALDQTAPEAWSRAITDQVAESELQVVPGCGHALFYEDCEATTEAVLQALLADGK
jgi:pimeloyl-ACP methyl ester carboxylesterase